MIVGNRDIFDDIGEYDGIEDIASIDTIILPAMDIGVSRKPQKRLSFAVRLALTLLLLGFLFKSISWPTLLNALAHINQELLLVSLGVGIGGIILSAYQWRGLLLSEKIRADLTRLIELYLVGIAFNHFLPTGMGGDGVKAFYVGKESNNVAGSASAAVMCRATGFLGMLLLSWPILLLWHKEFASTVTIAFAILSLLVGGMILFAILAVGFLSRFFQHKWGKQRFLRPIFQIGDALLISVKRPYSLLSATLYGLIFQLFAALNCYVYAYALGIQAPFLFYCVAVPLIALVSFLPFSINGYGLRESSYVFIFSTLHVHPSTAILLALLQDAQTLLFGIVGGCIYFRFSRQTRPLAMSGVSERKSVVRLSSSSHSISPLSRKAMVAHMKSQEEIENLAKDARDFSFTPSSTLTDSHDGASTEVPTLPRIPSISEGTVVPSTEPPAPLPQARLFRKSLLKDRKVQFFSALCLVVVLGAGVFAIFHKGTPDVTLYRASIKDVTQSFGGGGTTYPFQSLSISYPFASQVLSVFVRPGDKVTAQQPLVQLDFSQTDPQYIAKLNAQVSQARQVVQADQAYLQSVQAKGNPIAIAQAQRQLQADQASYNTLNAEAKAISTRQGKILSTISGVVVAVNISAGQLVAAGKSMVTIYDESKSIVRVDMPMADYGHIQINQSAQVAVSDQSGQTFAGQVVAIIPTVSNESDTFPVWIEIDNVSDSLLPGLSAFASIQVPTSALVVPRLAVLNSDLAATVFVVRQQQAYIQPVQVQGQAGDWLIITSGLQVNDLVVLTGLDGLSNGQTIHVTQIES